MVKNNAGADEKIRPFIIVGSVCMQQERLEKTCALLVCFKALWVISDHSDI